LYIRQNLWLLPISPIGFAEYGIARSSRAMIALSAVPPAQLRPASRRLEIKVDPYRHVVRRLFPGADVFIDTHVG
jgi:hypothetical protein